MSKNFDELKEKLDEIIVLLGIIIMQEAPISDVAEAGPIQPLQQPLIPVSPQPYLYPETSDTPLVTPSKCPKCGIDCSGNMGYVCSDIDCGIGLGPSICGI